ncbi:hypothetical protein [Solidesulfovibrio sp.]
MSQAADRLRTFYNPNDYDPTANPGGMAAGGHRELFVPVLRDVATVAGEIAVDAALAEQAAAEVRAATLSGGGLVVASPTDTVAGSLASKIEVVGLDKTVVNQGGNERLVLTAQPSVGSVLFLAQTCNAF